jgi:hypothetical protein
MTRREKKHYYLQAIASHAHWRNRYNHTGSELDLLNASYQQGLAEAFGKVLGMRDKEIERQLVSAAMLEESKPFTL